MRWIAILSAFALAACSTVAENSETQESINQKIAKGKTTKAEVKATFGEPSSTTSEASPQTDESCIVPLT